MHLEQYIRVYQSILSLKTISTFIKYINSIKNFEKGKIGGGGHVESHDKTIRNVERYLLKNHDVSLSEAHWANFIKKKYVLYFSSYLHEQGILEDQVSVFNINQLDVLKYVEGGHYKYHVDGGINIHRTLSGILILNNDYEGGELCFKNTHDDNELIIKPVPGNFIVWPSNFLFPHKINPITKGTRYSVVGWA